MISPLFSQLDENVYTRSQHLRRYLTGRYINYAIRSNKCHGTSYQFDVSAIATGCPLFPHRLARDPRKIYTVWTVWQSTWQFVIIGRCYGNGVYVCDCITFCPSIQNQNFYKFFRSLMHNPYESSGLSNRIQRIYVLVVFRGNVYSIESEQIKNHSAITKSMYKRPHRTPDRSGPRFGADHPARIYQDIVGLQWASCSDIGTTKLRLHAVSPIALSPAPADTLWILSPVHCTRISWLRSVNFAGFLVRWPHS